MKRTAVFLMAVMLLCAGLMGFPALAETAVKDGIEVTITTGRDRYEWWQPVDVLVTVYNTNSFTVRNASLVLDAGQGYGFPDGNSVDLGNLLPNTAYQFSAAAVNPDAVSPVPQTGDPFPFWPLAAAALLSLSGICLLRSPGARRLTALLLCAAVLGGTAHADIIRKSIYLTRTVQVDDHTAAFSAALRYDFYGVKQSSHHSSDRTTRPDPTPEPLDLSRYIRFPDLVDLNISEGVTITAEGLPELKPNQAVYVYADCSFVLTTDDGEHEVPYTLTVNDELVEEDSPAVIFTEDGSAVVAIELQPPRNMPSGVYNGNIEFVTKTVTNYKAAAD